MKNILFIFSALLFSACTQAGTTSGQIGVSLTIIPVCSVNSIGSKPQTECGDNAALTPKITRSKPAVTGQNNGDTELITVEW